MKVFSIALALVLTPVFSVAAQDSPKALQQAFVTAATSGDVDAMAALYTEDATNYPIEGALAANGQAGVRASWGPFLDAFTITNMELFDTGGVKTGDLATSWGLFTMTFVPKSGGDPVTSQGRFTDVSQNFDGTWLYIFDHASIPPIAPVE